MKTLFQPLNNLIPRIRLIERGVMPRLGRESKSMAPLSRIPFSSFSRCNHEQYIHHKLVHHLAPLSGYSYFSVKNMSTNIEDLSLDQNALELEFAKEIEDVKDEEEFWRKRKASLVGVVVSAKTEKTVNVKVSYIKYIRKYNKRLRLDNKIMAHDEKEIGSVGDVVRIIPCRPVSKRKRYLMLDVIRKAATASTIKDSSEVAKPEFDVNDPLKPIRPRFFNRKKKRVVSWSTMKYWKNMDKKGKDKE